MREKKNFAQRSKVLASAEARKKYFLVYEGEETEITHVVDDVSKIIKEQAITYAEGLDKICFIIDRDRESFVSHPENDQYSYVLNKCKDNGFGFYLTNPCFEFWLLLHFDEVMNLDMGQLLENPKVTSKRRYTEQQLRALMPRFTKSKYDVDMLMQRIDKELLDYLNITLNISLPAVLTAERL